MKSRAAQARSMFGVFLLVALGQPLSATPPRLDVTPVDTLSPGDPAPLFVMRDLLTDSSVFLRDWAGKELRRESKVGHACVVVLSFWATWCEPCKVEIPLLTKLAAEFNGDPVKFFLVNTMERQEVTEDTVRAVYGRRGYTLPCVLDASGRVARNYTVRGLPMIVVIGQDGVVRKVNRGYHENFHIDVKNLIKDLLKNPRSVTRP